MILYCTVVCTHDMTTLADADADACSSLMNLFLHHQVIPSRGEGWGRPHVEAMSCGVPVIATNWSGPTAYLTEENGFPLRYEAALVPAR